MKKMMSLIGSALLAGVAMAAEVNGNNAAVVIKKDAINSGTNYQFLCAPVAGFDITGTNKAKKIPLEDIVSPASVAEENKEGNVVKVIIGSSTYVLNGAETAWVKSGTVTQADEDETIELAPGQTFWLQNVTSTVTFCGQNSELGITGDVTAGGLSTLGNAGSQGIKVSAFTGANLPTGLTLTEQTVLMVIDAESNDYKRYYYTGDGGGKGWKKKDPNASGFIVGLVDVEDDKDVLKPGEAFYVL